MGADKMADTAPDAGATLGAVGGLVLDLAPDLGRWLFGTQSALVLAAVQAALGRVTGSTDPGTQAGMLADPVKAGLLRVELARIAAAQAEAASAQVQAALLSRDNDNEAGHARIQAGNQTAWGAPIVSLVVLLTFAIVMVVALTRTMPSGAEPVLNVLLGTLGAMATSVVGYWVGSSAGSARKEERLASLAERA